MVQLQHSALVLSMDWVSERLLWAEEATLLRPYRTRFSSNAAEGGDGSKTFSINGLDLNFGGNEVLLSFSSRGSIADLIAAPTIE